MNCDLSQFAGAKRKAYCALLTVMLLIAAYCHAATDISVRDHGARGDGTHDDAAAIRAAIAAAANAGGGMVRFPAGRYLLRSAEAEGQLLTLLSGVHLVSDEGAELIDAGHPSVPGAEWSKGPLLRATGATDCQIRGLSFNGPGQALYMRHVQRLTIQDCRFTGHNPMSIYGDRTSDVQVLNCHFDHVDYGLYLRAPNKWKVRGCRFLANGRAIEAQGAVACEVIGNFVDGKDENGKIQGIVGFLFFPNSGGPEHGGASTVGNLIANNEVHNIREEGISLDCRGNAPQYYYGLPGMMATADANSFTDASNKADELKLAPSCYVVILSGPGAGQYRLITSVRGKTLSVSPAWDTIPDSTSRYTLLRAAVENRIIGNKVVDVELGSIMLYGACLGNEVRNNTVVGSRTCGIVCGSLRPDVHNGMSCVLACFDNTIVNNTVGGIGEAGRGEGEAHPAAGIVLRNWYGGEEDVQNYRNAVLDNKIDNFRVAINVRVQSGAVVRGNTITNCGLAIKWGDHLTNCILE